MFVGRRDAAGRRAAVTLSVQVLVVAVTCWGGAAVGLGAEPASTPEVVIQTPQGVMIHAELADTTEKRARGLMFRESLAKDRGMLFTFAEAQPWSFWMKNTRIRLDIIWLDANKKIIHVERNVPICTRTDDGCPNYQPNAPAFYVLELAAGVADELNLKQGVKLKFTVPPS